MFNWQTHQENAGDAHLMMLASILALYARKKMPNYCKCSQICPDFFTSFVLVCLRTNKISAVIHTSHNGPWVTGHLMIIDKMCLNDFDLAVKAIKHKEYVGTVVCILYIWGRGECM